MKIVEVDSLQVVIIQKSSKSEDFSDLWERHDDAIADTLTLAIEDPKCADLLNTEGNSFLRLPLISEQVDNLGMIVCKFREPFHNYLKLRKSLLNSLKGLHQ